MRAVYFLRLVFVVCLSRYSSFSIQKGLQGVLLSLFGLAACGGDNIDENLGTPQTPAEGLRPSALPLLLNTENNMG
jgi:hypothetical protein